MKAIRKRGDIRLMGKKEVLYIILTALLFSTMEVALKVAGNDLDPFQLTFIRFFMGGLFLLPFALKEMKQRRVRLNKSDVTYLFVLGMICICISMLFFQLAIMQANANLIAILISSNPVFTMIFAHFIVEDRFTRQKALVLVISLAGVAIVANPFHLGQGNTLMGILFGVIASVTFGLYSAMGKLRIEKIGDVAQTSLSFLFGSFVMLFIMLFMGKPILSGIQPGHLPLILYLGIVVTGIGYYFYFEAIHMCGPSRASIVFFLKPVFAPVVALVFLREAITWNIILGIVFLLAGSILNMTKPRHKLPDPS